MAVPAPAATPAAIGTALLWRPPELVASPVVSGVSGEIVIVPLPAVVAGEVATDVVRMLVEEGNPDAEESGMPGRRAQYLLSP